MHGFLPARAGPSRAARTLAWAETAVRTQSRGLRQGSRQMRELDVEDGDAGTNDFILSILNSGPSSRDTKFYLDNFAPRPRKPQPISESELKLPSLPEHRLSHPDLPTEVAQESPLITSLLDPITQHTALVKIQGPFTERQLESIARGMVYLEKLGLVSVIVVENDDWERGEPDERLNAIDDAERLVVALEQQGARARPVLQTVVRLGPGQGTNVEAVEEDGLILNAHTEPADLESLRSALRAGEIPVLAPLALDSHCRTIRVEANQIIAALAQGMVEAAEQDKQKRLAQTPAPREQALVAPNAVMDLTPLRLMIINREGGVPSYARNGLPHLLVNLESEFAHVRDTFLPQWSKTHPTALTNLALARQCLRYMPPTSSAIMVSHRSPKSLIGNLITNKPAQSSSLPHALLSGPKALTPSTPTLIRYGLPMQVLRSPSQIDKEKMTRLLEASFRRTLIQDEFYERLEKDLDFAIVAGDYQGAAIVTREQNSDDPSCPPIAYLDKFAVLPSHQGDGTVDFLWVALRDESYGLGLLDARNPNVGGLGGEGTGRDLVWRSRVDNPVNKWYFERSSGHVRLPTGGWVMFWCDAEERLARLERERKRKAVHVDGHKGVLGLSYVEGEEAGRLEKWAVVAEKIPSSWVPRPAKN